MKFDTNSLEAEAYIAEAESRYTAGKFEEAKASVLKALSFRRKVELFSTPENYWDEHMRFIDVMIRAFVLLLKLGYIRIAYKVYKRAWAWADDPCCSSQRRYERAHEEWDSREIYQRSGRWHRRRMFCPAFAPLRWLS